MKSANTASTQATAAVAAAETDKHPTAEDIPDPVDEAPVDPPVEVEHPPKRIGCPLEPHATTAHSPLVKPREEVECASFLDAA